MVQRSFLRSSPRCLISEGVCLASWTLDHAQACIQQCTRKGFCGCAGRSANQLLSCTQGCLMRARGAAAATCTAQVCTPWHEAAKRSGAPEPPSCRRAVARVPRAVMWGVYGWAVSETSSLVS